MNRRLTCLLPIFLVGLWAGYLFSGSQKAKTSKGAPELAVILERCAAYCEKLENSALYFVCTETMRDEVFEPRLQKTPEINPGRLSSGRVLRQEIVGKRTAKNDFVYDYQLVRNNGRMDESRTLLSENGRKKQERNAQLKTSGYRYKNIVFGPVVLLGRPWQSQQNYEIIGEEKVQGTKTVVIRVTPKPGKWLGYLFGTIWVGKADSSILRIEWSQESVENYRPFQAFADKLGLKPDIVLTGEYGYEKNGIRFPSKFSIREAFRYRPDREFSSYKLTVDFSAYRFFTVETEVAY
jgi:hypothetical protein